MSIGSSCNISDTNQSPSPLACVLHHLPKGREYPVHRDLHFLPFPCLLTILPLPLFLHSPLPNLGRLISVIITSFTVDPHVHSYMSSLAFPLIQSPLPPRFPCPFPEYLTRHRIPALCRRRHFSDIIHLPFIFVRDRRRRGFDSIRRLLQSPLQRIQSPNLRPSPKLQRHNTRVSNFRQFPTSVSIPPIHSGLGPASSLVLQPSPQLGNDPIPQPAFVQMPRCVLQVPRALDVIDMLLHSSPPTTLPQQRSTIEKSVHRCEKAKRTVGLSENATNEPTFSTRHAEETACKATCVRVVFAIDTSPETLEELLSSCRARVHDNFGAAPNVANGINHPKFWFLSVFARDACFTELEGFMSANEKKKTRTQTHTTTRPQRHPHFHRAAVPNTRTQKATRRAYVRQQLTWYHNIYCACASGPKNVWSCRKIFTNAVADQQRHG